MLMHRLKQIIGRRRTGLGKRGEARASHYYRAYVLNDDGHIFDFAQLAADDDEDAKRQARHLREGFDIEVWQQDRLVARLKAPK
jgi:hypothetical protein